MQTTISFPAFLSMFESFNRDIWPLQLFTIALGMAMAIATAKRSRVADRTSAAGLGLIWIFVGAVFQWGYFRPIYEPAGLLAALWILQGLLFLTSGAFGARLSFTAARDGYAGFGFLLIAYALVAYPVLGYLLRSELVYTTWFGPFPCPVAVFTIGMFLLSDAKVPKYLTIIPLFWALGGVVPLSWGVTEDIGLFVGGTVGIILLFVRDFRRPGRPRVSFPR